MSKKLPRTSERTLDDLRKAANSVLKAEEKTFARITPASFIVPDQEAPAADAGPVEDMPTERGPVPDTVADQEKQGLELAATAHSERRSSRLDKEAFRKSAAHLIVERHANFAALAGLVPMPWVDLAAIAVVVDRMLRKVARLYGVPLESQRSKQLATALLTGLAAPGIASFTTTSLLRMAPGPHFLGMALTSVSATVLVRVVGEVYVSHLSSPDKTEVALR